ncbi:MAG: hypothetical protein AAFQ94_14760 [Bacteroidota bacterium]
MFRKNQLNKALTIILWILFASVKIWAQDETVTYSTTVEEEENSQVYRYFDINQYEQKLLFKVDLFGAENLLVDNSASVLISSLGLEYKYKPAISFDVDGMFSSILNSSQSSSLGAGVRYYPSKRVGSKAKNYRVNNFTGSYLRLGYSGQFNNFRNEFSIPNGWDFSYGLQQKVGKWGYLDLAAVLTRENFTGTITLGTKISGGIAYGKSKKVKDMIHRSPKNDLTWSKPIFFIDNPNVQFSDSHDWVFASFSSEIHIKNYWTVRPSASFSHIRYNRFASSVIGGGEPVDLVYNFSAEFRKYLGIRRRIEKGIETVSFSGFYLSLTFENLYLRSEFFETDRFRRSDRQGMYFAPQMGIGWQHRVGNRFLFDVSSEVGYSVFTEKVINYSNIGVGILLNE